MKMTMKQYIKSLNFATITTVLTWSSLEAIFMPKLGTLYMADPEDQIQYFNAIIMWLLELHAPLRRYIISNDVNPWLDVEKAMIEGNIAYRVWRDERLPQTEQDLRNYDGKSTFMKRFLDPNLPAKTLWRNLDSVGM
jgi:hypothetical protein